MVHLHVLYMYIYIICYKQLHAVVHVDDLTFQMYFLVKIIIVQISMGGNCGLRMCLILEPCIDGLNGA